MNRIKKLSMLFILGTALLFFSTLYLPLSREKLSAAPVISLRIVDRHKVTLREVLSDEGGRCRWAKLEHISPHLVQATVAAEDKHFFLHPGVDFLAVLRAFLQNIKKGRVVSGASTISQQLARNITHRRRNIFSKIYEAWLALRLEKNLEKEEILAQYLNRICYGNQAYGIEAASRLYFDKNASDLSLAEAAFLSGLPRSPSKLNPYRHFHLARKRQKDILNRMWRLGYIDPQELSCSLEEKIVICSEKVKFRAPHFCDFILKAMPLSERRKWAVIHTTLDYPLQEKVESLVKNHIRALEDRGISNAAVVVLENETGAILAMVGSKDFFDDPHQGQVNGVLSLRQPGSTLKPFTYALALENDMTAATVIEDKAIQFSTPLGAYRPQNYDQKYHGPVSLRTALACSYNIPAVSVLRTIGPDLLYLRLKKLGLKSLRRGPGFYGIGLTLGNGEVTLLELARAYATLARGGIYLEEKSILSLTGMERSRITTPRSPKARRISSPQVSFILTHILSDPDARIPSFGYHSALNVPFPCAAKTGTSKDFRDNWTVGYTPKHTVGVWVGNFDGKPMHRVSGITGCGPLFKDVMLLVEKKDPGGRFEEPEKLVHRRICPQTGKLASVSCPGYREEIFIQGTEPHHICSFHQKDLISSKSEHFTSVQDKSSELRVTSPQDGDIFKIDPVLHRRYQAVKLEVSFPGHTRIERVEWWANSQKIGESAFPFSFLWPLKPGFYTIKATAREGGLESQPVRITVWP
ncbi:MAG: penicillin-binding protein 1C [Candidatus Aminicenantes bacterium]